VFTPYGLRLVENCAVCQLRSERLLCDLSPEALQAFEAIKCTTAYPRGAVLFVEGQAPSGIFLVCKGTVKISACSNTGKVLVLRLAKPGEILGLSAVLSDRPFELTAETAEPCQVNFVKRNAYLQFLREYPQACFKVTEQLSERYRLACQEVRWLGLVRTAEQRLAKLLLDWSQGVREDQPEDYVELTLTQEEIAELIGTTRETVTRVMADFKRRQILELAESTLIIRNRPELSGIVAHTRHSGDKHECGNRESL
jgi:CRP/FNR family transcriptional regulator, cyclic AMP receptor protein